jgi:hypothetical protein
MRFTVADWALLVLAIVLEWVARSLLATWLARSLLGTGTARPTIAIVAIALTGTIVVLIFPQWLVLRRCLTDLRLGRWLRANALGFALGLAVGGLAMAFLGPQNNRSLQLLSGTSVLRLLFNGLGEIAWFLPRGLLLQRLSGLSAWPYVVAGGISTTAAGLPGGILRDQWSSLVMSLGTADVVVFSAALGLAQGTVVGLALGAGLIFMARRSAQPR